MDIPERWFAIYYSLKTLLTEMLDNPMYMGQHGISIRVQDGNHQYKLYEVTDSRNAYDNLRRAFVKSIPHFDHWMQDGKEYDIQIYMIGDE